MIPLVDFDSDSDSDSDSDPEEVLQEATSEQRADKGFMLLAVKKNGELLRYATARLRDDRQVVLEAVKQNSSALKWAGEAMKADHEVVLEAVKQNGLALEWAGDVVKADREVALEAVRVNVCAIIDVHPDVKESDFPELREALMGWARRRRPVPPRGSHRACTLSTRSVDSSHCGRCIVCVTDAACGSRRAAASGPRLGPRGGEALRRWPL